MNPTDAASPEELEWLSNILIEQIPLGAAMQLRVERLDRQGICLGAPLDPNRNDKGTAFGGALASMMILAGWSLPRLLLRRLELDADLVIGRCQLKFSSPVTGPFTACCDWPAQDSIEAFIERFGRAGRSSLELAPVVRQNDRAAASLEARYAALTRVQQES